MSDAKSCLRCSGGMAPGTLREIGQYGGNSPFVWAPLDDAPFPVKNAPIKRLGIVIYRCEKCGCLELYAPLPA